MNILAVWEMKWNYQRTYLFGSDNFDIGVYFVPAKSNRVVLMPRTKSIDQWSDSTPLEVYAESVFEVLK